MGPFSRGLSKAAIEQLRQIVREEARAEIDRTLNPKFIETVTNGLDALDKTLSTFISYDDELANLKASVRSLEANVARLIGQYGGPING